MEAASLLLEAAACEAKPNKSIKNDVGHAVHSESRRGKMKWPTPTPVEWNWKQTEYRHDTDNGWRDW
jgi:hypothetical protein